MSTGLKIEDIKSKLFLSVLNFNQNKDILNDVPYEVKGEFALVSRMCVGVVGEDGFYQESSLVTNEMLLEMEMDIDSLIEISKANSKALMPGKISSIADYLSDSEEELKPDGVVIPQVYVLTNDKSINGSAALFYQPELIDNLSVMVGKDLLIFPAGENEMFCIPIDNSSQIGELQEMFNQAINDLGLDEEKPLSANIMRYDAVNHNVRQMDESAFTLDDNMAKNMKFRHAAR